MTYTKTFPKTAGSQTEWIEVKLTAAEEKKVEQNARLQNVKILNICLDDAKSIVREQGLKDYQTDIVNIALALFEKTSSHLVFHKENFSRGKLKNQKP